MAFWSLLVEGTMVQKQSALCAKKEDPFPRVWVPLCTDSSAVLCFWEQHRLCSLLQLAPVREWSSICVFCVSSSGWDKHAVSKCSVSGESVERTQTHCGRGRWSEARKIKMLEGRSFMVNVNTHRRRVVKEDGDCVRVNLNTGWTEVNGIGLWYVGPLLVYSSVFSQDCSARGPHKEFGENKTTGIKDHCLALTLVPSANIYSHCVNKE